MASAEKTRSNGPSGSGSRRSWAQVGPREVGRGEHVLARVDAGQPGVRMAFEHAPRGDAGPGAQLERPLRVDPVRRARQLVLHAIVVRHLGADHLQVAVRVPMELPHGWTVAVALRGSGERAVAPGGLGRVERRVGARDERLAVFRAVPLGDAGRTVCPAGVAARMRSTTTFAPSSEQAGSTAANSSPP